jgi:hypothetical protein
MQTSGGSTAEPAAGHPLPAVLVDPGHQQPFQIIIAPARRPPSA